MIIIMIVIIYIHLQIFPLTSFAISDYLSKILHSLNPNWIQFYCCSLKTHSISSYPSPVYQVFNVNWSAFLKGILPTLQSHNWNNGTNGGCQLCSGDMGLLPLTLWSTGMSLATVWVPWLLMGCPKWGVLQQPIPPHPTTQPTHPSVSNILVVEKDSKNIMKFNHQR